MVCHAEGPGRDVHADGPLSDEPGAAAGWNRLAVALGIVGVLALAALQIRSYDARGGLFDYFPLYHGAREWLVHGDAYGQSSDYPQLGEMTRVGNAYPMHAVLLLAVPLAWIPEQLAGVVWVAAVGLAWIAAIAWARESWHWLLWLPMWDALRMQQVSAAVTVAAILGLGALRRGNRAVFLLAMILMSVKPQQTLFLLLAFAVMGRRWWRSLLAVGTLASIATIVAQHDWIAMWLHRVGLHAELVPAAWWPSLGLLVPGAILLARGWRESGLAVLSTAAAPWPLTGHYVSSAWPLGARGAFAAGLTLASGAALLALAVTGNSWVVPPTLILGTIIAALVAPTPRPSQDGDPPSAGRLPGAEAPGIDAPQPLPTAAAGVPAGRSDGRRGL